MEKKRYFIYAYDDFYGGLHGIYDMRFEYCTLEDAKDWGIEMSSAVIESYGSAIEEWIYAGCETEEEREDAFMEDIAFEIYELRNDAPSFKELEEMNLDPRSYIEEYCKPNGVY